jgi:hypothetical protein
MITLNWRKISTNSGRLIASLAMVWGLKRMILKSQQELTIKFD